MHAIDNIKRPVENEMEDFEIRFKASMRSRVALLDKITHYIIKRKGKQLRPMFVFLSAKMFGTINDSTFNAASLIELLHTATLVHDDVVDDANKRRGFFSLNALWKNKIAVLVGDYLLSRGLLLAVDNKEYDVLRLVSNAVREMSEGELLQMEKTRTLNLDEDIYFDIIRQKTATLIASCCASGAASVTTDTKIIEQARLFGEKVGLAFQIKDDLFDYGSGAKTGKPTGIDIREKKATLPLIYALNNADKSTKNRMVRLVKNHKNKAKNINAIIEFVISSGGLEYSEKKMWGLIEEAENLLNTFPKNEAQESLKQLIRYTVEREK